MEQDLIETLEEMIRLVENAFEQLDNDTIMGIYVDPFGALKDAKDVLEIAKKRYSDRSGKQ